MFENDQLVKTLRKREEKTKTEVRRRFSILVSEEKGLGDQHTQKKNGSNCL